jgi:hypothetical protein
MTHTSGMHKFKKGRDRIKLVEMKRVIRLLILKIFVDLRKKLLRSVIK